MSENSQRTYIPLTRGSSWFLEKYQMLNRNHWNLNLLLEIQQPVNVELLKQAIYHLLESHEGLRLHFVETETGWKQYVSDPDCTIPIPSFDLSMQTEEEQLKQIQEIASFMQLSLDIVHGPLQKFAYFDRGPKQPGLFFWVIHHLLTDAFSNYILVLDLKRVYRQLIQGKKIKQKINSYSFKTYTEKLEKIATSSEIVEEVDNFWLKRPWNRVSTLPFDTPEGMDTNTAACVDSIMIALEADELADLQKYVLRGETDIIDVLITSVMQMMTKWTGTPIHGFGLQNHGRTMFKDSDLLHMVGYIAASPPMIFSIEGATTPDTALALVKQQHESMPNEGNDYITLWCFNKNPELAPKLLVLPHFTVEINYLGRGSAQKSADSLIQVAHDFAGSVGEAQGSNEKASHALFLLAGIQENTLYMQWSYSKNLFYPATIEKIADSQLEALRAMIAYYKALPVIEEDKGLSWKQG